MAINGNITDLIFIFQGLIFIRFSQTKNADLCLTDYKIVKCESNCNHNNVSYIGSIEPLQLCIDSVYDSIFIENITCPTIKCIPVENIRLGGCFYETLSFWCFVFLMCLGTIGFNVSNCVSDAACFDVLGDKTMKYGAQRVWGTIGFGFTALFSGIFVHIYHTESSNQNETLTPALLIMLIFGIFDLISIKWLELPKFTSEGESIATKVMDLLHKKEIVIFLCFAALAGILDSFIIYYLFWYLEELAEQTGYMDSIKLIEACVVASECLGGEILFFLFSGRILKRIGYIHCLSFCFFMYFIRLGLISLMPSPWWLVLIEFFMQGSSYALCYTCIVAYASAISPMGTQNTIQGLVAGMDDGVGFAIGSIIGGQMYRRLGGLMSFRIFAIGALVTCFTHIILRSTSTETIREKSFRKNVNSNDELRDEEKMIEMKCLRDKNEVKAVIIIET